MLKLITAACAALALAAPAAGQTILQKAQEQQKKEQQQKAEEKDRAKKAQEPMVLKNARTNCNRQADSKKLKGEARKRYMDDCVKT